MDDFTEADVDALADKIESLELTGGEAAAIRALIGRAISSEVEGYGTWTGEVVDLVGQRSDGISAELGAGLGIKQPLHHVLFPSRN